MYLKVSKFFATFIFIFSVYYFRISIVPLLFLMNLIALLKIDKLKNTLKKFIYFFSFMVNLLALIIIFYMVNNIPEPLNENMVYKSSNYSKNSYLDLINELNNFDKYKKEDTLEKLRNEAFDNELIKTIENSKKEREKIFDLINKKDFEYPLDNVNKYSLMNISDKPQEKWGSLLLIYNFEIYEISKLLKEKDYGKAKIRFARLLEISKKLSTIKTNPIGLAVSCWVSNRLSSFYVKNRKELDMNNNVLNYIDEVSKNISVVYKNSVVIESYLVKNMIRYFGDNKKDFEMSSLDLKTQKTEYYYFPIRWPFLVKSSTINRFDKLYEAYYAISSKEFYLADKEVKKLIKKNTENRVFPNLIYNPYGDLFFLITSNNLGIFYYSKEKALSTFEAIKYILKKDKEIPVDRLSGEKFIVGGNRIKSPFIKDDKNAIDIEF